MQQGIFELLKQNPFFFSKSLQFFIPSHAVRGIIAIHHDGFKRAVIDQLCHNVLGLAIKKVGLPPFFAVRDRDPEEIQS